MMKTGETEMAALEATLKTMGEKIQPESLVLIETTVAPGTTEFVALPILRKAFRARGIQTEPLLAHSFERVMPGKEAHTAALLRHARQETEVLLGQRVRQLSIPRLIEMQERE